MLIICFCFSLFVWLEAYQFYWSFKTISFWFLWLIFFYSFWFSIWLIYALYSFILFALFFLIFSVKIQVVDLKPFLFYISIYYPLSSALSVSHTFCYIVVVFHLARFCKAELHRIVCIILQLASYIQHFAFEF